VALISLFAHASEGAEDCAVCLQLWETDRRRSCTEACDGRSLGHRMALHLLARPACCPKQSIVPLAFLGMRHEAHQSLKVAAARFRRERRGSS